MNKKGLSLGDMYPAVLTIVLIGIILGVGIYILGQVGEGVAADTITITNETITLVDTAAGNSVATASDCQARSFLATTLLNGSGGETIEAANYTLSTAGLLQSTAAATAGYNNSVTNISYTYTGTLRTGTTDPCNVLGTAETGTGGFATWIAVIVVVLAAAIVLGIVISSFGRRSAS